MDEDVLALEILMQKIAVSMNILDISLSTFSAVTICLRMAIALSSSVPFPSLFSISTLSESMLQYSLTIILQFLSS